MAKKKSKLRDILEFAAEVLPEAASGLSVAEYHTKQRRDKELKKAEKLRKEKIQEKRSEIKDLQAQKKLEGKWYEKTGIKSSTTKQIEAQQKRILSDLTGLGGEEALYQGEESLGNPIEGLFGKAAQAVKGANKKDFLKSLPSGFMEAGEGLMGLGETFIPGKIGSFSGALKKGIRKTKQDYEDWAQIEDREGLGAKGGRMLGEILTPTPGGKIKVAGKLGKFGKALATGALWGGIEAGKKDYDSPEEARKASLNSAMFGGGVGGLMHGVGGVASKITGKGRTKKDLGKIRKDANIKSKEKLKESLEFLGPEATIGEGALSETAIKKISRDHSRSNVKRAQNIQSHMRKKSKDFFEEVPIGPEEERKLYQAINEKGKKVVEEASSVYDIAKESGIAIEGVIPKKHIHQLVSDMKEAIQHTRGIPTIKGGGTATKKYLDELEMLLMSAPKEGKAFKQFAINNPEKIPTPDQFLEFKRAIRDLKSRASSRDKNALDVLDNSIKRIIEDLDTEGLLAKADREYAIKTAPFKNKKKQKKLIDGIKGSTFKNAETGTPAVPDVLGEQNTMNGQIFELMDTKNRKRYIGSYLQKHLDKDHPTRVIHAAWKDMPAFIKRTKDPEIQKILSKMEVMSKHNSTLTQLQKITDDTIGSRPMLQNLMTAGKPAAYVASLFTGGPTLTGALAAGHLGTKAALKGMNSAYRKRTGQKNLKRYLNPKLLEESILKDSGKYSRPLMKSLIYEENK